MDIEGYQLDDQKLDEIALKLEKAQNVLPPENMRFNALKQTPLSKVKVVILGQDPYHKKGQAHGLSFSVPTGVKCPPSLKNIYKEIESNFQISMPTHGNLTPWAKQGVLLLNSVLSVEESAPASHANLGWEEITDQIISQISYECEHVVFMLWGAYAQKKEKLINAHKHLILKSPHPSPFSAYKGFFGNAHFQQANNYLIQQRQQPITWHLT